MPGLFVAGSGTDVGKTFVAAGLIHALRASRRAVEALKPLASGFDPDDWGQSDPGRLAAALGQPADAQTLEALSPWRFRASLSPDMAAEDEGRSVDYAAIVALCRRRLAEAGNALLLIEGVGGVMSPIDPTTTNLDLMAAIGAPVLLVAGGYLGTISHALTAIAAVRARGLDLRAVVVSDTAPDGPPFDRTVASIAGLAPQETVIAAPRDASAWTAAVLARLD
jgi:dethiobiotin synthetase